MRGDSRGAVLTTRTHTLSRSLKNSVPDSVSHGLSQNRSRVRCPSNGQRVSLAESTDTLGQQYNSPLAVVCERGADLAIVGRAIVSADDPAHAALKYKTLLWEAYQQRVNSQAVRED
ncbi:hypothetical protein J6590_040601 [Homalodisca vitripennis]|nr:hypothetical protein J6590_040601 [Homalodisca vitripennis]